MLRFCCNLKYNLHFIHELLVEEVIMGIAFSQLKKQRLVNEDENEAFPAKQGNAWHATPNRLQKQALVRLNTT